jgi:hypothetical protein
MNRTHKINRILLILLGVLGLVLKKHYNGPYLEFVNSYLGNVSISFAVYFLIGIVASEQKLNKLTTAVASLTIVELFEVTNGFGVMTNVFDSFDLIANLVGVGLAFALDSSRILLFNHHNSQVKENKQQSTIDV